MPRKRETTPTNEEGPQQLLPMETLEASASKTDLDARQRLEEGKRSLLGLGSISGLGTRGLRALGAELNGDFCAVWDIPTDRVRGTLARDRIPAADRIASELAQNRERLLQRGESQLQSLRQSGAELLLGTELPESLTSTPFPAWWLFVQGNVSALTCQPLIAVVGTRQPTPEGVKATGVIARTMAAYPLTLVSGLAEGIDAEAHRVSLQESVMNVAFLGHGLNLTFPASTAHIREQIVTQGGAVATEYLPQERYQKVSFVERNRLQAALAKVVIPVQSRLTGGTAHTFRYARQFDRQILGIQHRGENTLLVELEKGGYPVLDVFTLPGRRLLDSILRQVADAAGLDTYAFSAFERKFRQEVQARAAKRQDLERLGRAVLKLAEQTIQEGERSTPGCGVREEHTWQS